MTNDDDATLFILSVVMHSKCIRRLSPDSFGILDRFNKHLLHFNYSYTFNQFPFEVN